MFEMNLVRSQECYNNAAYFHKRKKSFDALFVMPILSVPQSRNEIMLYANMFAPNSSSTDPLWSTTAIRSVDGFL